MVHKRFRWKGMETKWICIDSITKLGNKNEIIKHITKKEWCTFVVSLIVLFCLVDRNEATRHTFLNIIKCKIGTARTKFFRFFFWSSSSLFRPKKTIMWSEIFMGSGRWIYIHVYKKRGRLDGPHSFIYILVGCMPALHHF